MTNSTVMRVVFGMVSVLFMILIASFAGADCACRETCRARILKCTEDAALGETFATYECNDEAGLQTLACGETAEAERAACLETCGADLIACFKSARGRLKQCTKSARYALKGCLSQAKYSRQTLKSYCKNEFAQICMATCAPECFDGIQNQDETDVDCGGITCLTQCGTGAKCLGDFDCRSFFCESGICATPESCTDGVKNQDETDVDCGGSFCAPCADGQACFVDTDCENGRCSAGTCAPYSCSPVVVNDPAVVQGDTSSGALYDGGACQYSLYRLPGVAYVVTAAQAGTLRLSLESSADLGLYVREICELASTEHGCADAVSGGTETLELPVAAGETLSVVVRGFREGASGPFTLGIETVPLP